MEWCSPDFMSILHYYKSIRTDLACLVSVLWPLTLPHTPLFRIIKMVKFAKYIAIYGQIWPTIVIPGLEVIFCTAKNLLEEKEWHRYLIMGIHETISAHCVLWFHKTLPQYLDFTCREHMIVLFERCFSERQFILNYHITISTCLHSLVIVLCKRKLCLPLYL